MGLTKRIKKTMQEQEREGEREGKVTAKERAEKVEGKKNRRIPDVFALVRPNWSRSVSSCLALQSPAAICLTAVTLGFVFPL